MSTILYQSTAQLKTIKEIQLTEYHLLQVVIYSVLIGIKIPDKRRIR
jgi:hypothetical protein